MSTNKIEIKHLSVDYTERGKRFNALHDVPFARPRKRDELVKTEEYGKFRNRLLSLLYHDVGERIGGEEVII